MGLGCVMTRDFGEVAVFDHLAVFAERGDHLCTVLVYRRPSGKPMILGGEAYAREAEKHVTSGR
jgi:hypothetical protein